MSLVDGKPQSHHWGWAASLCDSWRGARRPSLALLILAAVVAAASLPSRAFASSLPGLVYTNSRDASVPWSIHVVQLERANPLYQIQSIHARGKAIGLDTLSDQLGLLDPAARTAVAAINGDFYQRDKAYEGAPRGLQIESGELLSGPSGGASFWIDALGEPHADQVESRFQITWPDGSKTAFGLNGERRDDGVELYTPAVERSTHTTGGRELVLVPVETGPWLPLHIGRTYKARVREVRERGDTPLAPDIMLVSLGPKALHDRLPSIQTGDILQISTASQPALHGI